MSDETDRELLELAAKAADIEVTAVVAEGIPHRFGGGYWNPLTDDGDALRLAVKLKLEIQHGIRGKCVYVGPKGGVLDEEAICHNEDEFAATRRAITRAAAEIGKQRS